MAWPEGTELLAVDKSEEMIQRIWPGNREGQRKAICADWLDFPDTDGGYDAVFGDGVFVQLSFPAEFRALAARAHQALRNDGILIARLFVQPPQSEPPEAVIQDLLGGRIGNFHVFKFRLAMALQASSKSGVPMAEVFDAWKAALICPDELSASTGWSRDAVRTIDLYQDKPSRLYFPSFAEFNALVRDHFELLECRIPTYEMGDRCPIVCYRKRAQADNVATAEPSWS